MLPYKIRYDHIDKRDVDCNFSVPPKTVCGHPCYDLKMNEIVSEALRLKHVSAT
jgi:hypothetical protein